MFEDKLLLKVVVQFPNVRLSNGITARAPYKGWYNIPDSDYKRVSEVSDLSLMTIGKMTCANATI